MDIRLFILSVLFLVSIFVNNVHSKNIYLKAELPIYKKYDGINKKDSKDHKISNITDSYGFGLGYNFGNMKIDLSYENSNRTDVYDFYPQYSEVDAAELDFDTSKITATLVFNI